MTQNNLKIQETIYPLQHEEWLRTCRELNSAELDARRIYLFERSDLSKLAASQATRSDFETTVTFEKVES